MKILTYKTEVIGFVLEGNGKSKKQWIGMCFVTDLCEECLRHLHVVAVIINGDYRFKFV